MTRGSCLVDSVVITRPSQKIRRAMLPGLLSFKSTEVVRRPQNILPRFLQTAHSTHPLMKKQVLYTAEYDVPQCEDIQNVFTTCSQLRNCSINFGNLSRTEVTPDATYHFDEEHHPPSNRDSHPAKRPLQGLMRRSSHRPCATPFRNRPSALRFLPRPSGGRNQVSPPISIRCEFRPVCQPQPTGSSAVRLRQAS